MERLPWTEAGGCPARTVVFLILHSLEAALTPASPGQVAYRFAHARAQRAAVTVGPRRIFTPFSTDVINRLIHSTAVLAHQAASRFYRRPRGAGSGVRMGKEPFIDRKPGSSQGLRPLPPAAGRNRASSRRWNLTRQWNLNPEMARLRRVLFHVKQNRLLDDCDCAPPRRHEREPDMPAGCAKNEAR